MLEVLLNKLEEHLSAQGVITNVILRTERSLLDDTETHEVELFFALDEETDGPVAAIHIFPLSDDGLYEVEVELEREAAAAHHFDAAVFWEEARKVVPDVSLTERKRYITSDQQPLVSAALDFHFVLPLPKAREEDAVFDGALAKLARDVRQLLQIVLK